MRYYTLFFWLAGSLLLASCAQQHDPMEKYEELGVPKGFTKDTYKRDVMKSTKNEGGFNFFSAHFKEEKENKRRFRDVSRPLPPKAVNVFPWSSGSSRRSEELHKEIRKGSGYHNTPIYW